MSDAGKAVFLSYASQDAEAAKRIAEALRAAGVEVWFDQNELVGGDAWDNKIRKQIQSCALFVPIISANTQARAEGYFRLEWKLAVDRSHLMADDEPFLFPVVIDDTSDAAARVPDKFRERQWMRLNVKDTPESLASRVAILLSGDVGRGFQTPPGKAGFGDPALHRKEKTGFEKWWWLIFPIMGMAVPIIGVLKRPARPEKPAPVATTPAAPVSAVFSEARQLAEKARAMSLAKYDSTADDFATAEGLIKRALELEQNDAEIWTISSLFNTSVRTRGFDHGPVRREMARRDAERAVKLAPASVNALYALGRTQRDADAVAAEATFQQILARDPNHSEAMAQLAWVYDQIGRVDEAAALYEKVLVLDPDGAALTRYVQFLLFFHYGRFAEADKSVRLSMAAAPSANSTAGLAMLLLTWQGNAEAAGQVLASAPDTVRNQPRVVWISALTQMARRDPEGILRAVQSLQSDYIQDNFFAGPKAYFTGWGHALAGRHEAARVAWQSALGTVEARLKEAPENQTLHILRGQLLAWLGQPDEARREARTIDELRAGRPSRLWIQSPVLIQAALGDADAALPELEALLTWSRNENTGWPLTPALLRLDPRWDKLRGDPRFQELITKAEAAQLARLPPRDWPKDPELKQAFDLITGIDATAESCRLAEDMISAVLKQRPTDPEATVVSAMLHNYYLNRGYDNSEERYVLSRRFAERALQLAPNEPEALAAMAQFLTFRNADYPRAEELVRRAMALSPAEPRFARILTYNVLRVADLRRAFAQAKENAERFSGDALTQYDLALICRATGDLTLMEQAIDRTLALAPIGSAQIWKGWLAAWMHGDLQGFKSALDRISGNFRLNERAIYMRYLYACLSGDAGYGLEAVRSFSGRWMNDFYYVGPRALLLADLLALQGKTELAREEYGRALAEIERVAGQDPNDTTWERAKFWAELGAGRQEEARVAAKRIVARINRPYRPVNMLWWHDPIPAQILAGDRADALALIREAATAPAVRAQIRTAFQIDRRMAPFRDDPEIVALLAEPSSSAKATEDREAGRK